MCTEGGEESAFYYTKKKGSKDYMKQKYFTHVRNVCKSAKKGRKAPAIVYFTTLRYNYGQKDRYWNLI